MGGVPSPQQPRLCRAPTAASCCFVRSGNVPFILMGAGLLLIQLRAAGFTALWVGVGTYAVLKLIGGVKGLRAAPALRAAASVDQR